LEEGGWDKGREEWELVGRRKGRKERTSEKKRRRKRRTFLTTSNTFACPKNKKLAVKTDCKSLVVIPL